MRTECPVCGNAISDEIIRCPMCGTVFKTEDILLKRQRKNIVKEFFSTQKISFFVKNSLILLLSLLMLIFAFFPLYTVSVNVDDIKIDKSLEYKISATKSIVFFFDSFYEWDEDDIKNWEVSEKFEKLTEKIDAEYAKSEFDEQKLLTLIEEATDSLIRIELRSKENTSIPSLTVAAIVSFLYILVNVISFFVALYNFIRVLCKKSSFFVESLNLLLISIIVRFIAVLSSAAIISLYTDLGNTFGTADKRLSTNVIISIISVSTFVIYLVIDRAIVRKDLTLKNTIKNSISLVCAIAVICLSFAPLLNAKIKTIFSENTSLKTATVGISNSFFLDLLDSDIEEATYNDCKDIFDEFASYTKNDVIAGKASLTNNNLLSSILSHRFDSEFHFVFSISYFVLIAIVLFASLMVVEILMYLSCGHKIKKLIFASKLIVGIGTVINLALFTVFNVLINNCVAEMNMGTGYKISFSVVAIFMLCFVIAIICIPLNNHKIIYLESDERNDEVNPPIADNDVTLPET